MTSGKTPKEVLGFSESSDVSAERCALRKNLMKAFFDQTHDSVPLERLLVDAGNMVSAAADRIETLSPVSSPSTATTESNQPRSFTVIESASGNALVTRNQVTEPEPPKEPIPTSIQETEQESQIKQTDAPVPQSIWSSNWLKFVGILLLSLTLAKFLPSSNFKIFSESPQPAKVENDPKDEIVQFVGEHFMALARGNSEKVYSGFSKNFLERNGQTYASLSSFQKWWDRGGKKPWKPIGWSPDELGSVQTVEEAITVLKTTAPAVVAVDLRYFTDDPSCFNENPTGRLDEFNCWLARENGHWKIDRLTWAPYKGSGKDFLVYHLDQLARGNYMNANYDLSTGEMDPRRIEQEVLRKIRDSYKKQWERSQGSMSNYVTEKGHKDDLFYYQVDVRSINEFTVGPYPNTVAVTLCRTQGIWQIFWEEGIDELNDTHFFDHN